MVESFSKLKTYLLFKWKNMQIKYSLGIFCTEKTRSKEITSYKCMLGNKISDFHLKIINKNIFEIKKQIHENRLFNLFLRIFNNHHIQHLKIILQKCCFIWKQMFEIKNKIMQIFFLRGLDTINHHKTTKLVQEEACMNVNIKKNISSFLLWWYQ